MAYPMFLIFTNCVEGKEDEFNDWYDNIHLADVLKIPGIVSGTRFRLGDVQRTDAPAKYRYVAIYQLDTHDVTSVIAELKRRAGTDLMPLSDAMQQGREGYFFEQISTLSRPSSS